MHQLRRRALLMDQILRFSLVGMFELFNDFILQAFPAHVLHLIRMNDIQSILPLNHFGQALEIPLLGILLFRAEGIDEPLSRLFDHAENIFGHVGGFQHRLPMLVDHLPLFVHDIVIFQQMFADLEIVAFNLLLGIFNRLGDHAVFDGHPFFHPQFQHQIRHPLGSKNPQEIILQRQEKTGGPGVPLPTGPPSELIINSAAFMTFGPHDM